MLDLDKRFLSAAYEARFTTTTIDSHEFAVNNQITLDELNLAINRLSATGYLYHPNLIKIQKQITKSGIIFCEESAIAHSDLIERNLTMRNLILDRFHVEKVRGGRDNFVLERISSPDLGYTHHEWQRNIEILIYSKKLYID